MYTANDVKLKIHHFCCYLRLCETGNILDESLCIGKGVSRRILDVIARTVTNRKHNGCKIEAQTEINGGMNMIMSEVR